jgi:plasmid stabilization system protein ParE
MEAGVDEAEAFEAAVREVCEQIAAFPFSGKLQPALGRRLRSRVVEHHVIYFRPVRDGVQIVRFLHERRDRDLAFRRGKPVKPRKRTRKPA